MANHKLVFKNTLFLYVRVFLSMAIGLYTSRVVLRELGVDNFGIYSVVGSLSMMFSYFNCGISSSLMRFFSYEIANDNRVGLQKYFSSSLLSAIYIGCIIILLCETVGNWALTSIIDIPPGRLSDAMFVFQASILTLVIEIFKTCFLSLIIAEERMSFFAYISIAESLLKLVIVFMLAWLPGDKLKVYAILLAAVSLLILIGYMIFCAINFPDIKVSLRKGNERIKEIFSFTGWNTLANFADLCYIQGSNIILNIFYGVAYNATMGIANQVKNALYSFSRNLQTAANPHLTKEFAQKDYTSFSQLAFTISTLSCLLLYLFGLPIMLNTDYILEIWLTNPPQDESIFIRLIIIFCLIDSLTGPMWVAMQAYGKIRNYQIIMTCGWLLSVPAMWLTLKWGGSPCSIIIVQIAFNAILLCIRILFAARFCHIDLGQYTREVILRLAATLVISGTAPLFIALSISDPLWKLIASTTAAFISVPFCALYIAISTPNRQKILSQLKKRLHHGNH